MNPLHPDPEIAANRALALAQLRLPESKLHVGELESVRDPHCKCCLGHFCAGLLEKTGIRREVDYWRDGRTKCVAYHGEMSYLPGPVAAALDMTTSGQFVQPVGARINPRHADGDYLEVLQSLVAVNDNLRWKPKRMANFIEEQMRAGNFEPYRGSGDA